MPFFSSTLTRAWLSLLLVFMTCAVGKAQVAKSGGDPNTFAFVGVSVVPMDRERLVENQTVVVRAGRVVEIGPACSSR